MPKMTSTKQYFMSILLLATCAMLAHAVLESPAVDQYADNNMDKDNDNNMLSMQKRPAFFVGSRYGRSTGNGGAGGSSSKARRLIVVPRNDRFFLGSRYGKRASEYVSPYEQTGLSAHTADNESGSNNLAAVAATSNNNNNNIKSTYMSCSYTGVSNYYRCSSVDELNNIINRFTNAHEGMDGDGMDTK